MLGFETAGKRWNAMVKIPLHRRCAHVCIYVHIYINFINIYIYIYMFIYMCVCVIISLLLKYYVSFISLCYSQLWDA